jgi:NADH:ubiquinone oxidoreductase subunit F (NADH-binding)
VEVFVSPGGYICGEQSALIEAMEDRRAQPRNKPPELQTNGLYDQPTLVSNVETFAWAPVILLRGGEWYRGSGVRGCKGRRFFSISGDVQRPGAYEVPAGITVGEFLQDFAGGVKGELLAFAPSGPSGGFLPRWLPVGGLPRAWREKVPLLAEKVDASGGSRVDLFDIPMDLEVFRNLGLMIGAGVVVYNTESDLVDQAVNCAQFFRGESCGKCAPCRIGSQKIVEIAERLQQHRYTAEQFALQQAIVEELAPTMEATSICGLGVVASNPLVSLLKYFPQLAQACFAVKRVASVASGSNVPSRKSS